MPEPLSEENIYPYNPSLAAAIVFTALNGIWTLYHGYQCFWLPRTRTYKHRYTIPLFVAGLLSFGGYLVRIFNVDELDSVALYAVSASYIVIAPIFVCATLYLLLKYLITLCLPQGRVQYIFGLSPRWLGRIFITSDVTSFLTQCSGSALASSGNWEGNTKDIGVNILLVGLALQLATFTFYLSFLWRFVSVAKREPGAVLDHDVRKVLLGVWVASAFVQVRFVFHSFCPLHRFSSLIIPHTSHLTPCTVHLKNSPSTTSHSRTHPQPLKPPRAPCPSKSNPLQHELTSQTQQIRTIFRLVEFALGIRGYPFSNEWCLYVLEAIPMWIALGMLGWYHPVRWLQGVPVSKRGDGGMNGVGVGMGGVDERKYGNGSESA